MVQIGYALSSEEHTPQDLVRNAQAAEASGFAFALISDHFHPWLDEQGQSPFVWSVIGGIAQVTKTLKLGTGVVCPMIRIHPAIIAQAAATATAMMPGRFFLGLGTGENLNEHILGDHFPEYEIRSLMFREAIEVIRLLWEGGMQSYYGDFYTVENARIYTLPDELPPIAIAASGPSSAELAGEIGDALISTAPKAELIQTFEENGNHRPKYGKLTVCWAKDDAEARATAFKYWRNTAIPGELGQVLATPQHFEQAARMLTEEDVAEKLVCSSDAETHQQALQEFIDAGFDHVYVHQIGQDQQGFIDFYRDRVMPAFSQ